MPIVRAAIAGLGMTELGKVYDRSPADLAAEAVRLAATDAGLALSDLDGLLISGGVRGGVSLTLAKRLGLHEMRLLEQINVHGATAAAMVARASLAVDTGAASAVACVFADAPLQRERSSGASWNESRRDLRGYGGLQAASGASNPNVLYAVAARRHMELYGTTSEQLGEIAVAQRQWATGNPLATMRTPLSIAEHQASRFIAEPFHLLDCCLVSNGAIAVVVTSAERAKDLARPPVHVWGFGQGHTGKQMHSGSRWGIVTGAATAGADAMGMAGIGVNDVDVCELYDSYTYTVLVTLEDYGFCAKGEGGNFVSGGALAPGGRLACNTGGGHLSSYYMWGMTPLSEAIIQARGDGGARQAPRNEVILVSGSGGILEHHSTLVLSPHNRSHRQRARRSE